jgi:glycogenin glucosyltransferase
MGAVAEARLCAYVSLLSTDAYLPGVLVLHRSLQRTGTPHPFLLLITPGITARARAVLAGAGIVCRTIERPVAVASGVSRRARWDATYAKIHLFDLVDFDKIVFLDADMLVTRSLDHLFDRPHMSAVNAGGLLPGHESWTQLNSGLLVVEPSRELFAALARRLAALTDGEGGGDQELLHAQFPDWPHREELHLDHGYNMFHTHLDEYHARFGWTLDQVAVLHFIGESKPWQEAAVPAHRPERTVSSRSRVAARLRRMLGAGARPCGGELRDEAVRMWQGCYRALGADPSPPATVAGPWVAGSNAPETGGVPGA